MIKSKEQSDRAYTGKTEELVNPYAIQRTLSPIDRKYLKSGLGALIFTNYVHDRSKKELRNYVIEHAKMLDATDEEIKEDFLRPYGLLYRREKLAEKWGDFKTKLHKRQ